MVGAQCRHDELLQLTQCALANNGGSRGIRTESIAVKVSRRSRGAGRGGEPPRRSRTAVAESEAQAPLSFAGRLRRGSPLLRHGYLNHEGRSLPLLALHPNVPSVLLYDAIANT